MSNYNVNDLVTSAKKWVGYLEKKSNSQLDNFTANAGSKNYTCFARDYKIHTGNNFQAQPWCAMFASEIFVSAFGLSAAKVLLCGNLFASCSVGRNQFKNKNQFFSAPKIGDLIFFKNTSGSICHVGIVYNVDTSRVYTIEGNTSGGSTLVSNGGGVAKKSYALSYARIAGYGRPKYNDEVTTTPTAANSNYNEWVARLQKAIGAYVDGIAGAKTLSKTPTLKRGSKGTVVKLLQEKLNSLGYSCGAVDGVWGGNTNTAVYKYQKNVVKIASPDCEFTAKGKSWKKVLGLS